MAISFVTATTGSRANSVANGTTTVAVTITATAGDLLVVHTGSGGQNLTATGVASSPSVTFTRQVQGAVTASNAHANIWTATATASGSMTVTVTFTNTSTGVSIPQGVCVEQYQGAQLAATPATNTTQNTTAQSSLTTAGSASLVTSVVADWNGTTGTVSYVAGTQATGTPYQNSGNASFYYSRTTTPAAAGAKSYGVTAPTGQKATLAALELQSASSTAASGQATLAATSGGSFSGPAETARAATTMAATSGPTGGTRANAAADPSAINGVPDWRASGTLTQLTGLTGTPRSTGASTPSNGSFGGYISAGKAAGFSPGDTVSIVGWVQTSVSRSLRLYAAVWNGSSYVGVVSAGRVDITPAANAWTQVQLVQVLPTGTWTDVYLHTDTPDAVNSTIATSSVRIEKVSDAAITYADGDTSGWVWNGTAGASSSKQTGSSYTATVNAGAAAISSATSGTTATGQVGSRATATMTATSGTTAGGTAGVGITIPASSGTTVAAPSVNVAASATPAGSSGTTATGNVLARALATLAATSGTTIGATAAERAATTLNATSGTSATGGVGMAAQAVTSSSSATTATGRVGASAAVVMAATSGTTAVAGPPTAPGQAVLAAVSVMALGETQAVVAVATFAATSTITATADTFTPPFVAPAGPVVEQVNQPRWTLLVFDTVTGRVGYEVPFTALSWTAKLNDVGSCTATIPIEDASTAVTAQVGADDPRTLLREFLTGPWRYSLAVAYGSTVMWAGPFLPSAAAPDKPTVDISGIEFARLLDKRVLRNPAGTGPLTDPSNDLVFSQTTIPGVAYQVIQAAITGAGRGLPITCSSVPNLKGLDAQTYLGYDLVTAWKALQDIAARDDGPDIRFAPYLTVGTDGLYVQYELQVGTPYLPQSGPEGPDGPLPWTWDETTAVISPSVDAAGIATSYFVPGSGQDRNKLIGSARGSGLLRLGWPVLEVVDGQHTSETDQRALDSYAAADVAASSQPTVKWSVQVRASDSPQIGAVRPGDQVRLDVDRNLLIAPDVYLRRVTEMSGDGSDRVAMTVVAD